MKKRNDRRGARFVSLSLILIIAVCACCSARGAGAPDESSALTPTVRDKQIAINFTRLLERRHVSGVKIDEALSERSFELFLKAIDPNKIYFNQSDADLFAERYAKTMGQQEAEKGAVTPAFGCIRSTCNASTNAARSPKTPDENKFDFTIDEELIREKTPAVSQDGGRSPRPDSAQAREVGDSVPGGSRAG